MTTLYIAGPMRQKPQYNFPAFDEARDKLVAAGYDVISPADMDREVGFDPTKGPVEPPTEEFLKDAMERDLAAIGRSDGLALLPGWEDSEGANKERKEAVRLGKVTGSIDYWLRLSPPLSHERSVRTFATGATRDSADNKPSYKGFLSPPTLRAFGRYMHKHRIQSDGQIRDAANWQRGIEPDAYVDSLWRHVVDLWTLHDGYPVTDDHGEPVTIEDACCAIWFNAQGYLHEHLKEANQ